MPKVLVVDDSPTYLEFARSALTTAGFEVHLSEDMWIAQTVNELKPDAIILDVNLGHLKNGPVLAGILRKRNLAGNASILLNSTESAEALARMAADCGADGYLEKASDPAALVRAVRHSIRSRQDATAAGD